MQGRRVWAHAAFLVAALSAGLVAGPAIVNAATRGSGASPEWGLMLRSFFLRPEVHASELLTFLLQFLDALLGLLEGRKLLALFDLRAFFEIGRRNVFGKNRSLNFFSGIAVHPPRDALPTFTEYRVVGTYREPRVFDTAADAFVNTTFEQQTRDDCAVAQGERACRNHDRLARRLIHGHECSRVVRRLSDQF